VVCVIGAVILEMTEITVEVKCHFVLTMREDFELNVYLGMCIYTHTHIYIYIYGYEGRLDDRK